MTALHSYLSNVMVGQTLNVLLVIFKFNPIVAFLGWHLKSPTRPVQTAPMQTPPSHFQGMPPPSGPVGRKATSGRGGKRGQGTTPRSRKPRTPKQTNMAGAAKTNFPIPNDVAFQQQLMQHQQQQQQHGYAKPILLTTSSPGSTQYEALNLATNSSTNMGGTTTSTSSITAPKVVVVSSSASSPVSSASNVAKPTTPTSSMQTTQILRQNLMSVPTTTMSQQYANALRLPNIPQVPINYFSLYKIMFL
jgi:hypothetical protein